MNTYECPKAIYSLLLSVLMRNICCTCTCSCKGCHGVVIAKILWNIQNFDNCGSSFLPPFSPCCETVKPVYTRKAKIGYDHNIHIVARLLPRYLSQPSLANCKFNSLSSLCPLHAASIKDKNRQRSGDICVMITHFCMIMKSKIALWWERLFRFVTTIYKSEQ